MIASTLVFLADSHAAFGEENDAFLREDWRRENHGAPNSGLWKAGLYVQEERTGTGKFYTLTKQNWCLPRRFPL